MDVTRHDWIRRNRSFLITCALDRSIKTVVFADPKTVLVMALSPALTDCVTLIARTYFDLIVRELERFVNTCIVKMPSMLRLEVASAIGDTTRGLPRIRHL